MFRFTLLFLLVPVMLYAQNEELYLSDQNAITKQNGVYRCVKNQVRSRGYAKCYNCFSSQNQLVKELNVSLHISDSLKNEANKSYIYTSKEYGDYLIGDYKDGKPYNGFFKQDGALLDWMIYNFYKDGILTEQIYNDQYNTVTTREDTEEAWTTIDSRNLFTNGILTTGITIQPVNMKDAGGSAELVHAIKNGQTVYFMIGLFAMHYGEFIKIAPTDKGYLVQSTQSRHQVRLTYTANSRQVEILNAQNQVDDVINYVYYDLADIAKADHKRSFSYIRKDNQLFIEQVRDKQQVAWGEDRDNNNESSAYMNKIVNQLYTKRPLDSLFFTGILTEISGIAPDYFGQYVVHEGKAYGPVYKKGTKPYTYSMDVYREGKLTTDKQYIIRDKTLDEISAYFKTRE